MTPAIFPSMATFPPDPITCLLHATAVIIAYLIVLHLFLFSQTLTQLLILLPIKLP
jgi:hypothetical protein